MADVKTLVTDGFAEGDEPKPVYGPNSILRMCDYFGVSRTEFMVFWNSLNWYEKEELVWADMRKDK